MSEQWEPTGDESTQFWAKTARVGACGYCERRIAWRERVLVDTVAGRAYCEQCVAGWASPAPTDYPTRPCADCGSIYEQRYYHALGSCEPCNTRQQPGHLRPRHAGRLAAQPGAGGVAGAAAECARAEGGFEACASRLPTASWSHDR